MDHWDEWRFYGLICVLGLLAFLLSTQAWSAEMIFVWEYDESQISPPPPRPESFVMTYYNSVDPRQGQQVRIPNGERASCDAVPNQTSLTPLSICGRLPECPPAGVYTFTVQAAWGEQLSQPSVRLSCRVQAACGFDCTDLALPQPLQKVAEASNTPQGVVPPSQAALDQVVTQMANAPVATPAPTPTPMNPTLLGRPTDTSDPVQAALAQMPKTPV